MISNLVFQKVNFIGERKKHSRILIIIKFKIISNNLFYIIKNVLKKLFKIIIFNQHIREHFVRRKQVKSIYYFFDIGPYYVADQHHR